MTWAEDAEVELRRVAQARERELAQWREWARAVSPYLPSDAPPRPDAAVSRWRRRGP